MDLGLILLLVLIVLLMGSLPHWATAAIGVPLERRAGAGDRTFTDVQVMHMMETGHRHQVIFARVFR
jgi:hypothetical protein